MELYPTKELKFRLINEQVETLTRLNRRTDKSEKLISSDTDRSFLGTINGNKFKIISATLGKGAFCVMHGSIESESGNVRVEIHKVFKILLSIFLLFPIVGFIAITISDTEKFSPLFILITIGQILMIRYAFIGLAFNFLSKESLNRLRDVVDFEWIHN